MPVGEAQDCLEHLSNLIGNKDIVHTDPSTLEALKKYYELHRYHVNLPGDVIGMVHPAGHVGTDASDLTYYDHTINKSFKFNPITLEGEVTSSDTVDLPTNDLREKLIPLTKAYMEKAFRKPKCKFNIHLDGDRI